VKFADLAVESETTLRLEARAAAGHPFGGAPPDGCAVRIFTGAVMPEGMDTVFMQEDCRILETGAVALPHGLKRGANRRRKGEDIAKGAVALEQGRLLRPEDIGLAVALGFPRLQVRRRLKAAIFSTGDEIAAPGEKLHPGGIYDANRFMLHGLLRRANVEVTDLGMLRDDAEFVNDIEMRVKGRRLEDLHEGEPHLVGERGKMRSGQLPVCVLNEMEMLDQQIAAARSVAEQHGDLVGGLRVNLSALGRRATPAPSCAWMLELQHVMNVVLAHVSVVL